MRGTVHTGKDNGECNWIHCLVSCLTNNKYFMNTKFKIQVLSQDCTDTYHCHDRGVLCMYLCRVGRYIGYYGSTESKVAYLAVLFLALSQL